MKLLYTTLLACMLAGALTAQNKITLNWIMTDEQYAPLSGVNIYGGFPFSGTFSDKQGNISFEVSYGDELSISYLGYESKKVKINSKTQIDSIFVLATELILLPEILISAYSLNSRTTCHDCDWIQETTDLLPVQSQAILVQKPVVAHVNSITIHSYPNPTNSFLNLQSEKPLGQVDLFNLNGQKLKTYNFQQQFQAEIDLSGQPKGTYVLRSSEGWVERILKQ